MVAGSEALCAGFAIPSGCAEASHPARDSREQPACQGGRDETGTRFDSGSGPVRPGCGHGPGCRRDRKHGGTSESLPVANRSGFDASWLQEAGGREGQGSGARSECGGGAKRCPEGSCEARGHAREDPMVRPCWRIHRGIQGSRLSLSRSGRSLRREVAEQPLGLFRRDGCPAFCLSASLQHRNRPRLEPSSNGPGAPVGGRIPRSRIGVTTAGRLGQSGRPNPATRLARLPHYTPSVARSSSRCGHCPPSLGRIEGRARRC